MSCHVFSASLKKLVPKVKGNISDAILHLNKKKNIFSRTLSKRDWQNVESVTAISTAFGNISWSTISLPSFRLTNWDLCDINYVETWDTNLIRAAYHVKEKLPISDLYVMETESSFSRCKVKQIPEMNFRCFLLTLLDIQNGTLENSNLVLQKRNVLNSLINLNVGGERTACKDVIFTELMKRSNRDPTNDDSLDPFSLLKMEGEMFAGYKNLSEDNQEKLALALLLNLSFLNLAYLQNPSAITQIQNSRTVSRSKRSVKQ